MRRRDLIALLGSAAVAWPVGARAEQPAIPVIGFLSSGSPNAYAGRVAGFRKGLNEWGYIEGQDVAIEFRWAQGQYDRLPVFAADLVSQKVAVIVSSGGDVADTGSAGRSTTARPCRLATAFDFRPRLARGRAHAPREGKCWPPPLRGPQSGHRPRPPGPASSNPTP